MSKIYVTKTTINKQSVDELDHELYDEFGFDYDNFDDFITIEHKREYSDGTPIRIDRMIEILNKVREMGATHVQFETDIDHHGYEILSSRIELSSDIDINKYEYERNKEFEKRKKIQELQSEINKLSKE